MYIYSIYKSFLPKSPYINNPHSRFGVCMCKSDSLPIFLWEFSICLKNLYEPHVLPEFVVIFFHTDSFRNPGGFRTGQYVWLSSVFLIKEKLMMPVGLVIFQVLFLYTSLFSSVLG